jgi:uncharacterized phosphosugar-binding protein
MNADSYLDAVLPLLEGLRGDAGIVRAGEAVAASIGSGRRIWLARTSHTLHGEATHRGGGLVAAHVLHDALAIEPGDCVILGAPAGTTAAAVEIALETVRRGGVLVALTSLAFENDRDTVVEHVSGKRVHELADVVVDLGGPAGDGVFEQPDDVPGMRVIPHSGVTGVAALWMIFAEAVACLEHEGKTPLFFQSELVAGARARNVSELARYRATGAGYRAGSAATRSADGADREPLERER